MSKINRPSLIIVTFLVLLSIFLYFNLESYTAEQELGPITQVHLNSWHAAQTFLKQHHQVSRLSPDIQSILKQLQKTDVLVLNSNTPIQNPITVKVLTNWMKTGGHLILNANQEWNNDLENSGDKFLDSYGIRLLGNDYGDDSDDYKDTEDEVMEENQDRINDDIEENAETITEEEQCLVEDYDEPFLISVSDHKTPLQIGSDYNDNGFYTLFDASNNATASSQHEPNAILQYDVEDGLLTVMLDTNIWHNDIIGEYDNAHLLWLLTSDRKQTWFIANTDLSENLLERLWRLAPYVIFSFSCLLLFWAWRQSHRFGPTTPDPAPHRRQLLEHIEANALFDWNHHHSNQSLNTLRETICTIIKRTHQLDFQDDQSTWLETVSQLSQQSPDRLLHAMTTGLPKKEIEWTELISQLQHIRNSL